MGRIRQIEEEVLVLSITASEICIIFNVRKLFYYPFSFLPQRISSKHWPVPWHRFRIKTDTFYCRYSSKDYIHVGIIIFGVFYISSVHF